MVLEKTLESPLDCKEIQPVHPKGNQSRIVTVRTDAEVQTPNTLATCWKKLTYLKRPWCWERLKAGGDGDNKGWDDWMESPTLWTWVWVSSRSWWWTGRPAVLQSTVSQRVGHDWVIELNWTRVKNKREGFLGGFVVKIHLPKKETRVGSLIWEDPICHRATKLIHQDNWAQPLEPGNCNCWDHLLRLSKLMCLWAHALQHRRPLQ